MLLRPDRTSVTHIKVLNLAMHLNPAITPSRQRTHLFAPPIYAPAMNYAPATGALRGEKSKPVQVIHDHYRLGESGYFERFCGALLAVYGANLTLQVRRSTSTEYSSGRYSRDAPEHGGKEKCGSIPHPDR